MEPVFRNCADTYLMPLKTLAGKGSPRLRAEPAGSRTTHRGNGCPLEWRSL